MLIPPRWVISAVSLGEIGIECTFRCPTKNPNPNVSVVKVILLPLGTICCQYEPGSFSEDRLTVKHISLHSMHGLSRLVRDIKLSINYDLHLMVCVFVDQRCALLQSVEAGRDWGSGVVGLRGRNVSQIRVLVGNQRRFELSLCTGIVCEFERRHS